MWRDPGPVSARAGRRSDDVSWRRARDPGARDLVRRDRRSASSPPTATCCANVVSSQAELHARYGGVVPEIASRRHLELVDPGRPRGARRRRASTLDDVEPVAVTRGPGPDRRAARRPVARPRRSPGPRGCRSCRSTTCTATSPRSTSAASRSSRRFSACSRAAATRCSSTCATAARSTCSARRSTTPPARRSTRARACSGSAIPAAPAIDRLAREGDPDGVRVPGRARARARLLVLRPQDGAALRRARPRRRRARATAGRSRRVLPARDRARARRADAEAARADGAERVAVVGGVAANSELRAALPDAVVRAARALHRQRGDDRVRRAVRGRPSPIPTTLRSMRMRPGSREPSQIAALALVALAAALLLARRAPRRRRAKTEPRRRGRSAVGWQGLVGERPRRGSRSAAADRRAARPRRWPNASRAPAGARPKQERRWTSDAERGAAAAALAGLALRGVARSAPSTRITRVLNGFSAPLDAQRRRAARARAGRRRRLPGARRLPGVACRRPSSEADVAAGAAARPAGLRLSGLRRPRRHVALLDTGVDRRIRTSARPRRRGSTSSTAPAGDARKAASRRAGRLERHGTELAGYRRAAAARAGYTASRPVRRVFPIRVAGWQPDTAGGLGGLRRAPTS